MDYRAEGGAVGDDGHGKRAALLEVLRDDGHARDIEHTGADTYTDALAEHNLAQSEEVCVEIIGRRTYLVVLSGFGEREHEQRECEDQ